MNNNQILPKTIIKWHNYENNRQMPWKEEREPYKIWLSEIILQQTRVNQGIHYYNNFITKYPTIITLANANDTEVFKMWEGLGYYNRCKNLLATARYIAYELGGLFPTTYKSIFLLKGVGPYTAAAIASFAYNLPYAVVDGNVTRVLARYFNITTAIDSTEGKKSFALLAQQLLPIKTPAIYNQAIMDFGATVCKPKLPLCPTCVLNKSCHAYKLHLVNVLPVKQKKIPVKNRYINYIIATYKNKFYVQQRLDKDIWQNLWQFIIVENEEEININTYSKTKAFKKIVGNNAKVKSISKLYHQKLTHQYIQGYFIQVALSTALTSFNYKLVSKEELQLLAFPRYINIYLASLT